MKVERPLERIKTYMLAHTETLAVAESVTSGCLQAALSLAEDATRFFQGGITAYNLGQKARHLKIDPIHAQQANCVSEKVAIGMADQVCDLFSSNWGIGITGYAAPVPELNIRELFAFCAFAHPGSETVTKKIKSPHLAIRDAQQYFAETVLTEFSKHIWTSKR